MKNLTPLELHRYRSLVGLQVQYAQAGDTHKVADLHAKIMVFITGITNRILSEKTGVKWCASWSNEGVRKYAELMAEAMAMANVGFDEWKEKQIEIERWLDAYISQAVLQATVNTGI